MKREFKNGQENVVWDIIQDMIDHFEKNWGSFDEPRQLILKNTFEKLADTTMGAEKRKCIIQ
jgi:hypothetical protein